MAPSPDEAMFRALQNQHRDALPYYRTLLILCLAIGLAGIIAAFVVPAGWQPLCLIPGVIAVAIAIFPWLSLQERQERIDGLNVLADEWQDVEAAGDDRPHAKDGLISLLWSIYGSNQRG